MSKVIFDIFYLNINFIRRNVMLNNDFRSFYEFVIKLLLIFLYHFFLYVQRLNLKMKFYVLKKTLYEECQVITSVKR